MGFGKTDKELDQYFERSIREFPGAEILGMGFYYCIWINR